MSKGRGCFVSTGYKIIYFLLAVGSNGNPFTPDIGISKTSDLFQINGFFEFLYFLLDCGVNASFEKQFVSKARDRETLILPALPPELIPIGEEPIKVMKGINIRIDSILRQEFSEEPQNFSEFVELLAHIVTGICNCVEGKCRPDSVEDLHFDFGVTQILVLLLKEANVSIQLSRSELDKVRNELKKTAELSEEEIEAEQDVLENVFFHRFEKREGVIKSLCLSKIITLDFEQSFKALVKLVLGGRVYIESIEIAGALSVPDLCLRYSYCRHELAEGVSDSFDSCAGQAVNKNGCDIALKFDTEEKNNPKEKCEIHFNDQAGTVLELSSFQTKSFLTIISLSTIQKTCV